MTTPSPAVIEVLTGSPFGMQLISGRLPLFDPFGWDPGIGLDAAIDLLGWSCSTADGGRGGGTRPAAPGLPRRPVLAGPLELGLLPYQPGSGQAVGADHYLLVLEISDDTVLVHDPQGYPSPRCRSPPAEAWRGDLISTAYLAKPYLMRWGFTRQSPVGPHEALRRSLPAGVAWLGGRTDVEVSPGTLGQGGGRVPTADLRIRRAWILRSGACGRPSGCGSGAPAQRPGDLPVGPRYWRRALPSPPARPVPSAVCGGRLMSGDDAALAAGLRRLAPTYDELRATLAA